jgi:hypothetical protein
MAGADGAMVRVGGVRLPFSSSPRLACRAVMALDLEWSWLLLLPGSGVLSLAATCTVLGGTSSLWSDFNVTNGAQTRELLRLKIPITPLSYKVPHQEPPYCKFMDQIYIFVVHSSSSYPFSKMQPYEPIKVKLYTRRSHITIIESHQASNLTSYLMHIIYKP